MKKSSVVLRGKASSIWRNSSPPNKSTITHIKTTVPISFKIPVGKIVLFGMVICVLIWSLK